MRLEHHLFGGYVRYISPHIIINIIIIAEVDSSRGCVMPTRRIDGELCHM